MPQDPCSDPKYWKRMTLVEAMNYGEVSGVKVVKPNRSLKVDHKAKDLDQIEDALRTAGWIKTNHEGGNEWNWKGEKPWQSPCKG